MNSRFCDKSSKHLVVELRSNVFSILSLALGTENLSAPSHYANLSSTGGIVALGLAAKNWNVEVCTRQFEGLCNKAFTRRAYSNIPGLGHFISHYNHSQYETRPLQEALVEAYSEDEYLFGGSRPHATLSGTDVKVAVTSTSAAGSAVVFANYNRLCAEKCEYLSPNIFVGDDTIPVAHDHGLRLAIDYSNFMKEFCRSLSPMALCGVDTPKELGLVCYRPPGYGTCGLNAKFVEAGRSGHGLLT